MNILTATDFVTHHDEKVQQLGQLLLDIEKALTEKSITQQEFVELMVEVERLKKVITVSDDLLLYAAISRAIDGVITLAKMAKLI